jgi:hypothetical protein
VTTIVKRYFLVVAAKNDKAMPESVDMAPGGIARREVSRGLKPKPEIMRVLNVVRPPLGTWSATIAKNSSQVFGSYTASRICSFLNTLVSTPVLSEALRWISIIFSRPDSHFASNGLFGLKHVRMYRSGSLLPLGFAENLQEEVHDERPKQRESTKSQEDDLPGCEGAVVITDKPSDETIEDRCNHIENDAVPFVSSRSRQHPIDLTCFSLVALPVCTTLRSTW